LRQLARDGTLHEMHTHVGILVPVRRARGVRRPSWWREERPLATVHLSHVAMLAALVRRVTALRRTGATPAGALPALAAHDAATPEALAAALRRERVALLVSGALPRFLAPAQRPGASAVGSDAAAAAAAACRDFLVLAPHTAASFCERMRLADAATRRAALAGKHLVLDEAWRMHTYALLQVLALACGDAAAGGSDVPPLGSLCLVFSERECNAYMDASGD